jgi:predicted porin
MSCTGHIHQKCMQIHNMHLQSNTLQLLHGNRAPFSMQHGCSSLGYSRHFWTSRMKKEYLALAVLLITTGMVQAQTSVTIYGVMDAGIVVERGCAGCSVTKLSSGIASPSRIGFRGTEDLGSGMSAKFVLESGALLDTGMNNPVGLFLDRQAYVGLYGDYGGVALGRQYTPHFITLTVFADPFHTGMAGNARNLMASPATRMSNTLTYTSPNIGGFSGEFAYGFGEVAGDFGAGRIFGTALTYVNGPLNLRLAYHNQNTTISAAPATAPTPAIAARDTDATNILAAANYNFGAFTGYLAYGKNSGIGSSPVAIIVAPSAPVPAASTDSRDALIGVSVPYGIHTFIASYVRKDDRTAANQDADQIAVGYQYAFSKRTDLYTSYARINNKNGAVYAVGSGATLGNGSRALNAGVRHTF